MRVVVVGLEFGAEFVPIYSDHPGVTSTGIADLRADLAARVASRFGVGSSTRTWTRCWPTRPWTRCTSSPA